VVETSEALRLQGQSAASTLEEMTVVLQRMAVLQAVPWRNPTTTPRPPRRRASPPSSPPDETQLLYSLCLHGRGELGPGARRVRGADHGAAAPAGVQARGVSRLG
jgi:DNA polymerase III subunit gamma/tau